MLPRPQPPQENSLLSHPPPPPLPSTYKTKERKAPPPQPPEQRQAAVRCPRCDSSNTKFCYYNNYSLTQPRHFCKTCRRYWTKGGALRNVPIGGGCRKHKKSSRSSITAANSRLNLSGGGGGGFSPDQMNGLKMFPSSAVEFQYFGSLSFPPRLISSNPEYQYSSNRRDHMINLNPNLQPPLPPSHNGAMVLDSHTTRADSHNNSSLLGLDFNYPFTSSVVVGGGVMDDSLGGEINKSAESNMNTDIGSLNIASSIESLSSINQELHFKLQQQRLAMLYGDHVGASMEMSAAPGKLNDVESGRQGRTSCNIEGAVSTATARNTITVGEKPQPMIFHNLETTANSSERNYLQYDGGRQNHHHDATEWFFGGRNSDHNGERVAQNLHL